MSKTNKHHLKYSRSSVEAGLMESIPMFSFGYPITGSLKILESKISKSILGYAQDLAGEIIYYVPRSDHRKEALQKINECLICVRDAFRSYEEIPDINDF